MVARNRVGMGLSYWSARLHIAGGIHSLESIPGLHKRLKIRTLKINSEAAKWGMAGGGGGQKLGANRSCFA
jgi:hypothetical protein